MQTMKRTRELSENRRIRFRYFYPFLLGIFPALGLVSVNITQVPISVGLRSIVMAVILSSALYLLFQWCIHESARASLLCAWFIVFFFAYGHVYDAITGWNVAGFILGRHRFLFPVWLLIFGLGAWILANRARRLEAISRVFNIISVVLVLIPLGQIFLFEWQRNRSITAEEFVTTTQNSLSAPAESALPDIYYIILDSYSRQDMLLEYYDLDISGFVEQLEETGFYVVPCSQSNYGVTDLSLATSLNMDYIQNVIPVDLETQKKWISLGEPIRHSLVRQMLTERGYQTIAFETGVWWSELEDADVFFRKSAQGVGFSSSFWRPTEFEVLFLRTTLLRVVVETGTSWFGSFLLAPEREHAQFILYTLDQLEMIPSYPGAKFVFVHLMAPHAPFVFSPEGEFSFSETADPGFPNEITYLNTRLVPLVRTIIAEAEVPPIIILQSDHALDTEVRLANFIALYFPGAGESHLYPTMTPVNIFRLLFNEYFGQDFPLLPDRSYQSAYGDYYNFSEVTYPCVP